MTDTRPLAVITGASAGIGYALAKLCAENGFDLIIAADQPKIAEAARAFETLGVRVTSLQVDLSTENGVDKLCATIGSRPVDALLANAGIGLGHGFFDQSPEDFMKVVNTNITGTIQLIHRIGQSMRTRGTGKILITGSIAGLMPGSFQAVYNGTKAFLDSFSYAIRNELEDSGVTVTCLMPGATDTEFFARADMLDTKVGTDKKDDPADVARTGFDAMMSGEAGVVHAMHNKMQAAMAAVTPDTILAEQHRKMAAPGTGQS